MYVEKSTGGRCIFTGVTVLMMTDAEALMNRQRGREEERRVRQSGRTSDSVKTTEEE